jgi:alkanesulfonate monooxygenase SsuD/methylene tetrahydromethanopterin reductase-like flavin-dependent oxidoreductase (luciferase family)
LGKQADALVFDKPNAVFSDTSKVHRIDHVGAAFQVRGPLNTPQPPQGRLPLIVAADADESLIALADLVILDASRIEVAVDLRQRLKKMAVQRGGKIALLITISPESLARAAWFEKGGCDGFILQAPLAAARDLAQMIARLPAVGARRNGLLRERLELNPSGGARP